MLNVILGETLEHKRFFEQAVAGRADLLGRRAEGAGTGGGVLPTRWIRAVTAGERPAVVALGSNLGDRRAAITFAVHRLSRILSNLALSDIVETEPEGPSGELLEGEPLYLNAVVSGTTTTRRAGPAG